MVDFIEINEIQWTPLCYTLHVARSFRLVSGSFRDLIRVHAHPMVRYR